MAKKPTRRVLAAARALEKQRSKIFKPLTGIGFKPYRIWAVPKSHPTQDLGRFIEQDELAENMPYEFNGWVLASVEVTEEIRIKLATNPGMLCAGPYCLIYYPPKV